MKAGTTALCRILRDHPDIFMAPEKETFYFSNRFQAESMADYLAHFQGATVEKYVAEGTADYTSFPIRDGVAERIFTFNPKSRFIYIMRDPFNRMLSHYKHYVLHGKEQRPLLEALQSDPEYLWRGYYAVQLRPYISRFGGKAVWVGSSDNFKSAPLRLTNDILEWLELDTIESFSNHRIEANVSPNHRTLIDQRSLIVKVAKKIVQHPAIKRFTSDSFINWSKQKFAPKRQIDFESDEFRDEVQEAFRRYQPLLKAWTEELEESTGKGFFS
jgi:hypothetical protein